MSLVRELFNKSRATYDLLEDDKSKDIFLNRLLYNSTMDYKYINNIAINNIDGYADTFFNFDSDLVKKIQLLKSKGKKLVIYGGGFWGKTVYYAMHKHIACFCDRDSSKEFVETFLGNVSVISPAELIAFKENYICIIGTFDYYSEVRDFLINNGVEIFEPDIIEWLRQPLKNLYFESDFIAFLEDEIFIDGGSFDFASSKMLLEKCKSIKKIYAFEPNPAQYSVCVENSSHIDFAKLLPYGLWDKSAELIFNSTGKEEARITKESSDNTITIKAVKLDEILNGEKATFIKLDVEGAELSALKGAKQTIVDYRPKLAVCVYHKPEDIIEIPLYIHSLFPKYKFFLRHYSNTDKETVLYAI